MTDELARVLDQESQRTDSEGKWPERSIKALAEAGLLALTLPQNVNGGGADMRQFIEVTEKIASHCASTAMIYLMHVCAAQTIAASSEHRCAEVVQQIASRESNATRAINQ